MKHFTTHGTKGAAHFLGMMVFCCLLVLSSRNTSAQDLFAQKYVPSAPYGDAHKQEGQQDLEEVLKALADEYSVRFYFDPSLLTGKTTGIEAPKNNELEVKLNAILVPHQLNFKKLDQAAYVIRSNEETRVVPKLETNKPMKPEAVHQINNRQLSSDWKLPTLEKTVSGRVIDGENGEPLPGVNVLAKSTTMGTVTDLDGNYKLTVGDDVQELLFSSIGYVTEEVAINGRRTIDITLLPDIQSLSEVVVIGYGTQKKSDLSGAVSSVKGEDLQKTPANTLVQSLQGRAPGVDVRSASNAPGGGIRIRIRGSNSINASSEPLYVIDGFPLDNINTTPQGAGNNAQSADPLSSISPSEIESIEILKDASATAIYGARGANGVVLITTKRGQEGKVKVDFDYSMDVASVRKKLDLANAEELAILTNEWATNNDQPLIYDGVNKPFPEELGEGTDWQDQIFRTALTHTYNLSLSGGNANTQYLVSGNYLDQDGIIIESNFKRGGLKFNLDQKINERIRTGVNLNLNRTVNDAVPSDGSGFQDDSPLWNALTTTPVISVYDEDGNYIHNHDETVKILENPVSIAKTRSDITYTTRILSNAFAEIDIIKDLSFRANFGADIINSKRNVYIPNTAQTQALPNLGVASIGTIQSYNWLQEYTLTYNKSFGRPPSVYRPGWVHHADPGNRKSI